MHENLIKNQSFLLITTNVASALKLLEGSLSVSLLSVDLIIHRRRTRHACCQLSILISYFSLQQMEVCPLYFLCISPSEWRLNPREADRLWRSSRGKLGLLRFRKVLGVSVLTAGEATRLMCFFCLLFCTLSHWWMRDLWSPLLFRIDEARQDRSKSLYFWLCGTVWRTYQATSERS